VTQMPATVRQLPAQSFARSQSSASSARSYGSYTPRTSNNGGSGSFAVRGTSPSGASSGRSASSHGRSR
jgi:hypothetical protein